MKKSLFAVLAAGAVALSLGAAACATGGAGLSGSEEERAQQVRSAYGFSAASAGLYISAAQGAQAGGTAAESALSETEAGTVTEETPSGTEGGAAENPAGETSGPSQGAEQSDFDRYLALAEGLLSEGGFSEQISASDRDGYAYRMDVTYTGLSGSTSYAMYYNEKVRGDDRDDDDRDDWDDDEDEEEFGIEGVMVIDGAEYAVRGERSSESGHGEEESETELRVQLSESRVMLVEQSSESEDGETEREYTYTVLENGRAVERSAFSYEQEEGEEELKMSHSADGENSVFYFERENYRGQEVIRIRATLGGETVSYIARPVAGENGEIRYEYEQLAPRA